MTAKRKLFSGFHVFILALGLSAFLACLVLGLYLKNQKARIKSLEERLSVLSETAKPLKFMILSRTGGIIRARFRFYDPGGNELGSFEQSWPGIELTLDSIIIPAGERFLAFPCRVFTDALAPKNGTLLFGFYEKDGFPGIYDDPSLDEAARRALADFFALARAEAAYGEDQAVPAPNASALPPDGRVLPPNDRASPGRVYGNAVHDLKDIARFEPGLIYVLELHSSGAVEIREAR
jgi:hypothetical protein